MLGMLSFTSYTKIVLRLATFIGFFVALISFIIAVSYTIYKLTHWDTFPMGTAPILIGAFQLFFIGLIGEYIISINTRTMNRPLVIEEERINFN